MSAPSNQNVLGLITQAKAHFTDKLLLNADDIVSVNVQPSVGKTNTFAKLSLTNGVERVLKYNRESLAKVISLFLPTRQIEVSPVDATAVAAVLKTKGLNLSASDLIVTPVGTKAVKVEATASNIRFYGSINLSLIGGDAGTPPVAGPGLEIAFGSQFQVYDFTTQNSIAFTELYENATYEVIEDKANHSFTVNQGGTYIGDFDKINNYFFPMFIGDKAFRDHLLNVAEEGGDTEIPVLRMTIDGVTEELSLQIILGLNVIDGKFAMIIPLTAPINGNRYQLSIDNFATAGSEYRVTVNNTFALSEPEAPLKNYIISMDPTPQLYVGDYATSTAVGDVLENGVVNVVTDETTKTITLTLEGNYIGPAENMDSLLVPMYLGDADFYAEAVAQQVAAVNPNTPFVRIMFGDYPADVSLSSLLQLELLNSKLTSPIALSSPSSSVTYALSIDNFATMGDIYTFTVVNNIVFPILQLELPKTRAAFLANIYKDNTLTTLLTAQEYSEVTYAYSHDAATNSSTIDAVIHTSINEADAKFYLPVYFGDVAWANYVDGIVAANDHDTVIFRYMDGSNAMDCTIDMMAPLALTKVNGRYAMVATLWSHDPAVKIALSMDNFATESVYASIRVNGQIIAPMPAIEITPLGLSLTLGANQNDFLSRVSIGTFNVNGASALDDVVYDYVVDDTAKTITATLTATLDAENPADYIVPVYVGDYEFTTYVDRLIARGDTTTIVGRNRNPESDERILTAQGLISIAEKVNGIYAITVPLSYTDGLIDIEFSTDNFATPSTSYTLSYVADITVV